jgi:hypothetical protein
MERVKESVKMKEIYIVIQKDIQRDWGKREMRV